MTGSLRVAAVMDTWAVSGPGRQITALASALKAHGVELQLFMFERIGRQKPPMFAYLDAAGVGYTVIEERGAFDIAAFRRLGPALRAFSPDIIQSHHYKPTAFVLGQRLLGARWPWIGFFHGETTENAKIRIYNALHDRMLPLADRVVVLSEEHRGKFAKVAGKVRLIHNAVLSLPTDGPGIDLSDYRRPGVPLLGVLARLSREKGVDLLLDALAERHAAGAPASLVVAGDGPERANLERQSQALGIASDVHFLGFVADVIPLYRQLDAVVLPSRDGAEGMPNVLLEALNNDRPVVATAVAAVPEVLSDALAGELVPPGDSGALAMAIANVLATGRLPAASAARSRTVARFSLERRVATHLAVYRELIPGFVQS